MNLADKMIVLRRSGITEEAAAVILGVTREEAVDEQRDPSLPDPVPPGGGGGGGGGGGVSYVAAHMAEAVLPKESVFLDISSGAELGVLAANLPFTIDAPSLIAWGLVGQVKRADGADGAGQWPRAAIRIAHDAPGEGWDTADVISGNGGPFTPDIWDLTDYTTTWSSKDSYAPIALVPGDYDVQLYAWSDTNDTSDWLAKNMAAFVAVLATA